MDEIRICLQPQTTGLEEICTLVNRAHSSENISFGPAVTQEEVRMRLKEDGVIFTAFCGTELAGVAALHTDRLDRWYFRGQLGRLRFLAVDPRFRGRKIGRQLIAAVLQGARERGMPAVFFTTSRQNKKAQRLYRSTGCVWVDCHHYSGRSHASWLGIWRLDGRSIPRLRAAVWFRLSCVKESLKMKGRTI